MIDVDVFGLRQHRDRRRRGVDAAGRFGVRHALHAMHAGFEFQLGIDAAAVDIGDDFLVAADRAFALRHDFDLPALLGGIALIHAKQHAREQRGLVAAGAGADFQDDVALVHRVLRQQIELDLLFQAFERSRKSRRSSSAISRISRIGLGVVDQRLDVRAVRWRPRDRS